MLQQVRISVKATNFWNDPPSVGPLLDGQIDWLSSFLMVFQYIKGHLVPSMFNAV